MSGSSDTGKGAGGPQGAPVGLGEAGNGLWTAIVSDLAAGLEFDARERELLRLAAKTADVASELESALEVRGVVVKGSRGQDRVNPAVGALVGVRRAQAALLGQLDLSGEGKQSAHTVRARRAAAARWREHNDRKARGE